jgi:hypothetical protein
MHVFRNAVPLVCAFVLGLGAYAAIAATGVKPPADAPTQGLSSCTQPASNMYNCQYSPAAPSPNPVANTCSNYKNSPDFTVLASTHAKAHQSHKNSIVASTINIADIDRGNLIFVPATSRTTSTKKFPGYPDRTATPAEVQVVLERCTHKGHQDDEIVTETITIPLVPVPASAATPTFNTAITETMPTEQ